MKTLLFNGCSFVAGDEIAWDKYCLEKKGRLLDWRKTWADPEFKNQPAVLNDFMAYYGATYRKLHNLPMATSLQLGLEKIDISEDGNSNDNIAISTIAYLISKPIEERKQYHVCIGWTTPSRFLKFLKKVHNTNPDNFKNILIDHVGTKHGQRELDVIQKYIDITFQTLTDDDLWLNYVKNIMLLENFLISNGITYTFFKSLGSSKDVRTVGPFRPFDFVILEDQLTNNANWFDFGGLNLPYANEAWNSTINHDESLWVSSSNRHPSLKAVAIFSNLLADFIRKQNVLN